MKLDKFKGMLLAGLVHANPLTVANGRNRGTLIGHLLLGGVHHKHFTCMAQYRPAS